MKPDVTDVTDLEAKVVATKPTVAAVVQLNAHRIQRNLQWLPEYMNGPAKDLLASNKPPEVKLVGVTDLANRVQQAVKKHCACKPGCSHCCKQALVISSAEAVRLFKATERRMVMPTMMDPEKLTDMRKQYSGQPCPFLNTENDRCTVYEDRPTACRLHFNIGDDPSVCDIQGRPGAEVPNIDFTPLLSLSVGVLGPLQIYNDIREFFPAMGPPESSAHEAV